MIIIQSHTVTKVNTPIRLSDYAVGIFDEIPSRKGIKKAIKRGAILVNGEVSTTGLFVQIGMQIDLLNIPSKNSPIFALDLPVVYEDEHIALIFKPGGLVIRGNQFRTLENALLHNLKTSQKIFYPRAMHRLDAATMGLVLIAKTNAAAIGIGQQFEQHTIRKTYVAIGIGAIPSSGFFDQTIDGKLAYTSYECIRQSRSLKSDYLSLVRLFPKTGRTHQLRIHLSKAGFPILGDQLYGQEGLILKKKGLFLCATELSFIHPIENKKMTISHPIPSKFITRLDREQRRWDSYHLNAEDQKK